MPPVVIEEKFGWQNRYADDSVFCRKEKIEKKKKRHGSPTSGKTKTYSV